MHKGNIIDTLTQRRPFHKRWFHAKATDGKCNSPLESRKHAAWYSGKADQQFPGHVTQVYRSLPNQSFLAVFI